ncbi:MAG: DUF6337 family protein [Prevotellaceae bacterium]|jgi:hypothetical protein|nr:DUF6337 family protein [Prevotellaceae bacterium]
MASTSNLLILLIYFLEVVVLTWCERKLWKTLYTPLCCLMLPFSLVLLVTLLLAGNGTFVAFYYPTLYYVMIGLLAFFIPSAVLGAVRAKRTSTVHNTVNRNIHETIPLSIPPMKAILAITFVILGLYTVHSFIAMSSSSYVIGTDEFGTEYAGGGLWGHLRLLLMAITILLIYLYDRSCRWYLLLIGLCLVIFALTQVKGWILIPIIAGLLLRLCTGKTRLKFSFVLWIILLGFAVFFISYALTLAVGKYSPMTVSFLEIINNIFMHYLTSGILGMSMDVQLGFPEEARPEVLFAQIVNLWYFIMGEDFVSPINPLFFQSGVSGTNVRSLFGTTYLNVGMFGYIVLLMVISSLFYGLRTVVLKKQNLFIYAIDAWLCAFLCMGWFDYYFHMLHVIEIPVFLLLLSAISRIKWRVNLPSLRGQDCDN